METRFTVEHPADPSTNSWDRPGPRRRIPWSHQAQTAPGPIQSRQNQSRRGLQQNDDPFLPNSAFDPGHGPVSDPSSRRHHSAGRPPLIAPPGPCRSMLALGTIGAPTHRETRWWVVSVQVVLNISKTCHRGPPETGTLENDSQTISKIFPIQPPSLGVPVALVTHADEFCNDHLRARSICQISPDLKK